MVMQRNVIPEENLGDRLSRSDELQVMMLKVLRAIAAKLGAPVDGGGTPISEKASSLFIATVPLGTADNEVKWQFPVGMKTFVMHSRNGNAVRLATQPGLVTSSSEPYFTLKANTAYSQDDLNIGNVQPYPTFYLACAVANEVIEIIIGV
jgi:hypothetical protein